MRKIFNFLLIIVILAAIGGVGAYFSHTVIGDGEIAYIRTKFRAFKRYHSPGHYFFPEKLLFYDDRAFTRYNIDKTMTELSIPLSVTLPSLTLFSDKGNNTVTYTLALSYRLSEAFQASLIKSDKITGFNDSFKEWISSRDQGILLGKITARLSSEESVPVNDLMKQASQELYEEITRKYPTKDLELNKDQITHSIKTLPNLELYGQRYREAKKLDKDLINQQAIAIKESTKQKNRWDNERMKVTRDIERLKLYGKLFKEYPEALNYLYLQKLSDKVSIVVSPKDTRSIFAPLVP
ncbi:MAG: hypothetical protein OEZ36_04980, partial [Spirochaetota bacterium]|nr:hypothetical protein [Spirochaetota bacterium]